jgi:hypothetical protein
LLARWHDEKSSPNLIIDCPGLAVLMAKSGSTAGADIYQRPIYSLNPPSRDLQAASLEEKNAFVII